MLQVLRQLVLEMRDASGAVPQQLKSFVMERVRRHGVSSSASQQPLGRQVTIFALMPGSCPTHVWTGKVLMKPQTCVLLSG